MKWGEHIFGKDQAKMSKREYANVMSSISTNYHARFADKVGKQCSMAVGNKWYAFKNNGFGDYEFTQSLDIVGNEEYLNKMEGKFNG